MWDVFSKFVLKKGVSFQNDPGRKYKGRSVFQGNNVRDQNWNWAEFQELSSAPASMTASKIADV